MSKSMFRVIFTLVVVATLATACASPAPVRSPPTADQIAATKPGQPIGNPKAEYPVMAKRQGLQGKVMVRVFIDDLGMPSQASVTQSSGQPMLDTAALDSVMSWTFAPGRRNGAPAGMFWTFPITYSLN